MLVLMQYIKTDNHYFKFSNIILKGDNIVFHWQTEERQGKMLYENNDIKAEIKIEKCAIFR